MPSTKVAVVLLLAPLLGTAACKSYEPLGDGETGASDTAGDGDGDGETGSSDTAGDGDGDGDGDCNLCPPSEGDYPDCVPRGTARASSDNLEHAGECTVVSVLMATATAIELDCPSGTELLVVNAEPKWTPQLEIGQPVLLRGDSGLGGAGGSGWSFFAWRLDDGETGALIGSYTRGEWPQMIDDPLSIDIEVGACPADCNQLGSGDERVGVRFADAGEELLVFDGNQGAIGGNLIWVARAEKAWECIPDTPYGWFEVFVAAAPGP